MRIRRCSMARNQRHYDKEYKIQSIKLAKEIGTNKAARELGIAPSTLNTWVKSSKNGSIDARPGMQTPQSAMTLSEEVIQLRKQVRDLTKENRRLKETNDFLEEASAFFAASRLKSAKKND